MQRVSEYEVIAMQNVEGHDDLAVRAELHPTIELAVELVECKTPTFHDARTVRQVSHIVQPH